MTPEGRPHAGSRAEDAALLAALDLQDADDPTQLLTDHPHRFKQIGIVRPSTIARRIVSFDFHRKAEALSGLELADLVVSPLGRLVAGMPDRPDTEIVLGKLRTGPGGGWEGAGLVVLPKDEGRGPLRSTRPTPV